MIEDPFSLAAGFLIGGIGGAINSIAGGGTVLTFPALIALGMEGKVANATSTLGLITGSIGGAWGYRRELKKDQRFLIAFLLPSLLGGLAGALLVLNTPSRWFDDLVPWLILTATLLFMLQTPISRWLAGRSKRREQPRTTMDVAMVLLFQLAVAIYGGYFGAGMGILMLAALGAMGIDDIHHRNGIKNMAAIMINGVAISLFAASSLIRWPMSIAMAMGALAGGYLSAGLAKRLGQHNVRLVVIAIGLCASLFTALRLLR